MGGGAVGELGGRHKGDVRPGKVLGQPYTANGLPVCDVADSAGNVWRACRIRTEGGGPESFGYRPPIGASDQNRTTPETTAGGEVLLSWSDGSHGHPTVMGALPHTRVVGKLVDKIDKPEPDADHPKQASINDVVEEHGGARTVLSGHGTIVLDTQDSKEPVRVQLDRSSFLRVSQDGDASERVMLAAATRDRLDELIGAVNELIGTVNVLAAGAQAAVAALLKGTPPTDPTWALALAAMQSLKTFLSIGEQEPTTPALEAAALRISSRSELDASEEV